MIGFTWNPTQYWSLSYGMTHTGWHIGEMVSKTTNYCTGTGVNTNYGELTNDALGEK